MINSKISQFKTADKKFDNYSSLIFTTFILGDKYLKAVNQLEAEKKTKKEVISLSDVKKMRDENATIKKDLDEVTIEKDKYLQELIQKNGEFESLKNKIIEYEAILRERDEEIDLLEDVNKELEQKIKKMSHDLFLLKEEIDLRE
jgi:predicted nuclease with TOPRIM domain